MKKVVIGIIFVVVLLVLSGCGKAPVNHTENLILDKQDQDSIEKNMDSSENPKKTIALVMKTLTNPFFIDMEMGARKAEVELGVNLLVKTGAQETSIEQQIAIVEELIQLKVDAIVIAPGHSIELIPVLKKAQDAKIPIVNIDNRLDPKISKEMGLINVPFISVDNEQGAYEAAKYICDKITKPTKAVILEGIRGADNSEQRKNGILKAVHENKNIEMVAIETANWKIDEAFSVTSKIFEKHPDIGVIFSANDMMALGAIEYLVRENKKDVLVSGFDALEEAKKAIDKGYLQVTVNQQADIQGYEGVLNAVKMVEGGKVQEETIIPVKIIDLKSVK